MTSFGPSNLVGKLSETDTHDDLSGQSRRSLFTREEESASIIINLSGDSNCTDCNRRDPFLFGVRVYTER